MQGVDTDRVKLDDACWSVKCAECGTWFEAKRSDASFCSGRCRKLWHQRPVRKQNALADIRAMAIRATSYADEYSGSQDMQDALRALAAVIRKKTENMDVEWRETRLL